MAEHKPVKERSMHGGTQRIYRFPNGFGASVVNHAYSYGQELAVVEFLGEGDDWSLTYETPITDDVIGHLSDAEVSAHLDAIAALPASPATREAE